MLKRTVIWACFVLLVFFVAFRPGDTFRLLMTTGGVVVDILAFIGRIFHPTDVTGGR